MDENYTSYVMTNNTLAVDVIKLDEIEETDPSSAGNSINTIIEITRSCLHSLDKYVASCFLIM